MSKATGSKGRWGKYSRPMKDGTQSTPHKAECHEELRANPDICDNQPRHQCSHRCGNIVQNDRRIYPAHTSLPLSSLHSDSSAIMSPSTSKPDYTPFTALDSFFRLHSSPTHPGVTHVILSSPSTLNAITPASLSELPPLFTLLSSDPAVKVIILSGAGPAFSSGLDLSSASSPDSIIHYARSAVPSASLVSASSSMQPQAAGERNETTAAAPTAQDEKPDPARIALNLNAHVRALQACVTAIATCPKPVIAAIHGPCLGAGLDLACCADIRLASPNSVFSVREVHLGLAADLGVLSRLPKIVGNGGWVKEVCLTGRMIGAEEAGRVGLVSVVGEAPSRRNVQEQQEQGGAGKEADSDRVLNAALTLANTISSLPQTAVLGTKEILDYTIDHSVDESLRYTRVWNSAMLQTGEIPRAIEKVVADKKRRKRKQGAKL